MNQDQLIRFLIDNLDADAFSAAKRDGTSIMYLAGVAQRMTGNVAPTNTRQNRPAPTVRQETRQAMGTAPAQDLTEDEPTQPAPAARQPAQRNTPVRNNTINQPDRVRVSAL